MQALTIPSGKGHEEGHPKGHPEVIIIRRILTDDLLNGHPHTRNLIIMSGGLTEYARSKLYCIPIENQSDDSKQIVLFQLITPY